MKQQFKVAVLLGSLRRNSFSRRVADALMARTPAELAMRIVPIGALSLFNQDEEGNPPPAYEDFRATIRNMDAVLLVTPEYNRGVPGALKNALDVGSRPNGQNVFDKLPCAIVSQSPGAMGGMGANLALRPTLAFLNMPVLPQPEMYLSHVSALLGSDDQQKLNEAATGLFDSFLKAFAHWIALHAADGLTKELAA